MPEHPNTLALVVAAGAGERAGLEGPKQYALLGGKPLLRHCVERLLAHPAIDAVRVVIGDGQQAQYEAATAGLDLAPPILGAATRQKSVLAGLAQLESEGTEDQCGPDYVLIHDAARPFVTAAVVDRLILALKSRDAAIPVLPVADTLVRAVGDAVSDAVPRDDLYRVQTPQAFAFSAIIAAHFDAKDDDATDDASLLRDWGLTVATVAGDEALAKLTYPADFAAAEERLRARMTARTGMGFDVHAFSGPGPLVIGGITVPHDRGLTGHSDADVALHALTDALLGAIADGDIGSHFPPSDERWRGAASHLFLEHARDLIAARGGVIDHVDVTIICETPKIGPHRDAMRAAIAGMLRLQTSRVSVKATTTERLGFAGRGEGIAAQAVATVRMES